jgi:hypothetical protein
MLHAVNFVVPVERSKSTNVLTASFHADVARRFDMCPTYHAGWLRICDAL